MEKIIYFCKNRSIIWKLIISSIALLMFILVLMPSVASVDSKFKFSVSIKSNELDSDDIEIIPIEASSHYEYGRKAVETCYDLFQMIKFFSNLGYLLNWNELNESIVAWEADSNFYDLIDEFEGVRDELGLKHIERVLYMGRWLAGTGILSGKCTTTGATGFATDPPGSTFIHQNIDSKAPDFTWEDASKHITVAKIDGEYNYAFWLAPVIQEWPFLNEKDVGFVGNALGLSDNGDVNTSDALTDMPSIWLQKRSMMECDRVVDPVGENLNDVKDLWENADRVL